MNSTFLQSNPYIVLIKVSILIGLITLLIGIILMIRDRKKYNSYKEAFLWISVGLFIVFFSTIYNSLELNRWDKNSIINFLSLIHLGERISYPGEVVARLVALAGYAFFLWGLSNLAIVIIKRFKWK